MNSSHSTLSYAAFAYCTALKTVELGSGIQAVGEAAFFGCTSLEEARLLDTVQDISSSAFSGCDNKRLSIYGYPASYAYSYAKAYQLGFVSIGKTEGDVNGDGKLSIADVLEVQKHLAGVIILTPAQLKLADLDASGKADLKDVVDMQKIIAGQR